VIRDLGVAAVDLCVFAGYEHTKLDAVLADPAGTASSARSRVDRAGLVVSDVFAMLAPSFEELAINHPDGAARRESLDQFRQILEFTARLRAPGLTILPGVPFPEIDRRESLELSARELRLRTELASEAGVELSVEPHAYSIVQSPAAVLELLALVPSLSLTLDYSHFVFQGIDQWEVDPLLSRTRHIHLRQAQPGALQSPTTAGTIDFARMLDRAAEARYRGYLALEYQCENWPGFQRLDCIAESAALRDLVLASA
jgi:hydroxypyruvate isomerase